VLPRDVPLLPRASIRDVLWRRARLVGSRTGVGRADLGLTPGVVSPYEVREGVGLRYGDPPVEEARYERGRSLLRDAATLGRWLLTRGGARRSVPPAARRWVVSAAVDAVDTADAISRIVRALRRGRGGRVYFVHPHALNLASRDRELREELARAEMVLPDGIGLRVAASMLGWRFPANVNGTDLLPELLLELAAERIPVALIGGADGVAEKAAGAWHRQTGVAIAGTWSGFDTDEAYRAAVESLRRQGPCVVLVAMGTPHQERFVARYLADLPKAVSITVGGLFDFAAGGKPRAPLAWREMGMEWVWRLVHEPRRLGKRYIVGNPEFLWRVAAQRVRHHVAQRP
jgi:N-acetylglucosaminyldiphosphoundecaprenol N-acetyl-beta-D-mannosaminyltransferase